MFGVKKVSVASGKPRQDSTCYSLVNNLQSSFWAQNATLSCCGESTYKGNFGFEVRDSIQLNYGRRTLLTGRNIMTPQRCCQLFLAGTRPKVTKKGRAGPVAALKDTLPEESGSRMKAQWRSVVIIAFDRRILWPRSRASRRNDIKDRLSSIQYRGPRIMPCAF